MQRSVTLNLVRISNLIDRCNCAACITTPGAIKVLSQAGEKVVHGDYF
jgi:hypothetical protein